MKSMVDEIFSNKNSTADFVVRTSLLYFFELMGFKNKDELEYNCKYISKNDDLKKINSLFKDEELESNISFEKLVFFSHEKKAVQQKKLMKKFCKLFTTNIVDVLPANEDFLTKIVEKVCMLS